MNISDWSIRNPVPSVLLFALLTIGGLLAFLDARVQNFPDVDLPFVSVTTTVPGMAAAQVETEVAARLENAMATMQGLRHLHTVVQDGAAIVSAEFRLEKPSQEALDDTRAAVARVRGDLPAAATDPVARLIEFRNTPILTFTVASDRLDDEALSRFVDEQVTRRLMAVAGVGSAARLGGVSREARVELDPDRLVALGLGAAEVSRHVAGLLVDAPGGRARLGEGEQNLRATLDIRTVADLGALDIPLPGGQVLRLDQLASSITDGEAERRSGALLDGKPVVGFQILRAIGAGDVEVAEAVRAAVDELAEAYPDIRFVEAFNSVEPVKENYHGSMSLLYEGIALTIVIVGLFLRDLRATFICALALPLSILPTFLFMQWMGYTLNIITLLSLSLVIGVLVDDAIVEVENIMRHLRLGKTPREAAREAAAEIGMPVIATTFTLVAVFLPTAFMPGLPGKFFVQFGWTSSAAVLVSLLVARMLTPMMAAYMLRPARDTHREPVWIAPYLRLARWCLGHRAATMTLVGLFGLASFVPLFSGATQGDFMPASDLSQIRITVELPPGSTYDQTLATAEEVCSAVAGHPQVVGVFTAIGAGGASDDPGAGVPEARTATLTVSLTPRGDRPGLTQQDIERELREAVRNVAGARIDVVSEETYTLVLSGEDNRLLEEYGAVVEKALRGLAGIGNVTSSASLQRPEIVIRPDSLRAAERGVSTEAIAEAVRVATQGDLDRFLPRLNLGQRQVPVVVRMTEDAASDIEALGRIPVSGSKGPVLLHEVAELAFDSAPAQINRLDQRRNVTFVIALNGLPLSEVQARVAEILPGIDLPRGMILSESGQAETSNELGRGFALAMGAGVACIYIVLVLLFHAWAQPLTILGALVLSVPGALLALFLTGTNLSMPAMIGMVMLMGIATKNSILLVEYAITLRRDEGLGRLDALLDACRKRARPIVMTTFAMGVGMLPIALGLGADPSFRAPMAIVVIGGLITSTLLSLLVIPVLYTLIDDLAGLRLRRRPQPVAA